MRAPRLVYREMTPERQAQERARNAEYRRRNPEICRAQARRYYLAHREEMRNNSARQRCRKYGLSVAEFGVMLGKQEGLCAICGTSDPGKNNHGKTSFCIDHDHVTRQPRALLCNSCNRGLGIFRDNAALLTTAASYLVFHQRQFAFLRGGR